MFVAKKWRPLLEAGRRDGTPNRVFDEIAEALRTKAYTPRDFSVRDVFEHFVEDGREIASSWSPRSGGTRSGISLMESGVDTAAFANITGQIVFSEILDAFNDPMLIGTQLVRTVPTQFSGEKIPGIGRIGDEAESVAEADAYPMAGVSEEWIETPETTKRGFIVPVTKEAIFFDRTGLILQRAGEVGTWLGVNKEKRILDAVLGITSLYKRNGATSAVATYGNNSGSHDWDNLAASNGLSDWTSIENALLLFDDITDPNTGEPVMLNPNTIIVPTALSFTAQRIIGATELRQVSNTNTTTISSNPLAGARNGLAGGGAAWNVYSNQYVKARTSSASTWFIGDPQAAFYYMENWPITSVAAPSNSEMEFTHDIVQRFKVSERGAAAAIEPRRMVKCTA